MSNAKPKRVEFNLTEAASPWLTSVSISTPFRRGLEGAFSSSAIKPTDVALKTFGHPGEEAMLLQEMAAPWTANSIRKYCTARFGPPAWGDEWMLSTSVPDFWLHTAINDRTFPGFGYRIVPDLYVEVSKELYRFQQVRQECFQSWMAREKGVPVLPVGHEWEAASLDFKALYGEFLGADEKALAKAAPTPLMDTIRVAIAEVVAELTRPVLTHGKMIDLRGVVPKPRVAFTPAM